MVNGMKTDLASGANRRMSEADDVAAIAIVQDEAIREFRHRLISETAYRLYEQRGYVSGYELQDWLQAEAEVDLEVDVM
jgi:hypothetical protein